MSERYSHLVVCQWNAEPIELPVRLSAARKEASQRVRRFSVFTYGG